MITWHYREFLCGHLSWKQLCEIPFDTWVKEDHYKWRGQRLAPQRVYGRLLYVNHDHMTTVNPDTWEEEQREIQVNRVFEFKLIRHEGLVGVQGRKGDLGILAEVFDVVGVRMTDFVPFRLDLVGVLESLRAEYPRHEVKVLRIEDYLDNQLELISDASFKLMEPQLADKALGEYQDQLGAFRMTLMLPDGAYHVRVTVDGTVALSDDTPDDVLAFIERCLPKFKDAAVETVRVEDPENPAGMTRPEHLEQVGRALRRRPLKPNTHAKGES